MNKIFIILFLFVTVSFSQNRNMNEILQNTIYNEASEEIKSRKAFSREWVFFEERAYPNNFIPDGAYLNSFLEKQQMKENSLNRRDDIVWTSLGPTPGFYFSYGNISSRIVTAAYHPTNTDILYVGPANGGVWRTTNGGENWTPLSDNEPSLSMGALAIDPLNPNIIYAGTGEATYSGASYYGAGLLKTTDAGETWTNIRTGLPNSTYFSRLHIRPNKNDELIAALGNSGLYRSTNFGESWFQVLSGRCDDVMYTPTGDTVFVIGSGTGIRRSIDGGVTFQTFSSGITLGTRNHFDLCLSNPAFMVAVTHSSSSVTVYRSTNYGINWTSTASGLQGSQAWYDLYIKIHPKNPNYVFLGTIDCYRSTDGGINFTNITNGYSGGSVHVDHHNLFFHPTDDNTIISLNDGGIWRSTNLGNTFQNLNAGLTLTQFYRIASSPFNPSRILGGTQDNGTQQTFSAINWAAAFGGDGGEVCFNPFDQNFIIGETQNGGLRRTTNGGSTWVTATTGITTSEAVAWVAPIIHHPTISGTFYVARQRVYKSINNGGNWTAISGNVNGTSAIREMAISFTNPDLLYATSSSRVYRSLDGGVNWELKSTGLPNKTASSIYVHPENQDIAFVTFLGFGGSKVYKTTNKGESWISINGNLPDTPTSDILIYPFNPDHVYFLATDIGVFLTEDGGTTWTDIDNGLPNTVIKHLDYSLLTNTLRAGTHGRGVYEAYIGINVPVELTSFNLFENGNNIILNWSTATEKNNKGFEIERKIGDNDWTTIGFIPGNGTVSSTVNYSFSDEAQFISYNGFIYYRLKQIDFDGTFTYSQQLAHQIIVSSYLLTQNYPNPFNPNTQISFSLPNKEFVNLSVYNLLGEKVSELLNGEMGPGNFTIPFDAYNLPTGVYFYKITTQSFTSTKKMVLSK